MSRLQQTFAALKVQNRCAFIPFIMAGDPDPALSDEVLGGLPSAGADIIELGIPFSDPMADGAAVQQAGQRSLKHGTSVRQVLASVAAFRNVNSTTPVVLMGYYNPVYHYGVEAFARDAAVSGVDGVILVDVPPEEAAECQPALAGQCIDKIALIAPTTPPLRAAMIAGQSSGFLYYVAVKGTTGNQSANLQEAQQALHQLRSVTELPLALGFGIKTPQQAAGFAAFADAVVVGSSICAHMAAAENAASVLHYVRSLADAVHTARSNV